MNVQIFGSICSPSICSHILRLTAQSGGKEANIVYHQVVDHFYVDNWLVSFDNENQAILFAGIVSDVLKEGGFELAQWGSSSKEVLLSLPGKPVSEVQLDLEGLPTKRTLGLKLNYATDSFMPTAKAPPDASTRRDLLRATHSIYDPLGMLSAILVPAKLVLQDACRLGTGWDDPLDPVLLERWSNWASTLDAINGQSITRCFTTDRPM